MHYEQALLNQEQRNEERIGGIHLDYKCKIKQIKQEIEEHKYNNGKLVVNLRSAGRQNRSLEFGNREAGLRKLRAQRSSQPVEAEDGTGCLRGQVAGFTIEVNHEREHHATGVEADQGGKVIGGRVEA